MRKFPHPFSQQGLTLAEIGMAIFAISIGVLSIATVYLQRERAASVTAQQATASSLAAEMTAHIDAQQQPNARFENAIGVHCRQPSIKATPQAATTNEVACWQERVAGQLPNGTGSIALDTSTVPATYMVTVSWSQPQGGLASYTVRTTARIAAASTNAVHAQNRDATRAAN